MKQNTYSWVVTGHSEAFGKTSKTGTSLATAHGRKRQWVKSVARWDRHGSVRGHTQLLLCLRFEDVGEWKHAGIKTAALFQEKERDRSRSNSRRQRGRAMEVHPPPRPKERPRETARRALQGFRSPLCSVLKSFHRKSQNVAPVKWSNRKQNGKPSCRYMATVNGKRPDKQGIKIRGPLWRSHGAQGFIVSLWLHIYYKYCRC